MQEKMEVDPASTIESVTNNKSMAEKNTETSEQQKENLIVDSVIVEGKPENKDLFKKPVIFGPRKGAKGFEKKSNNVSNTSEDEVESNLEETSRLEKSENSVKFPPLPYTEPNWKGFANDDYKLEELKSGVIQRTINLIRKSLVVFGRVENCDVVMAHPTVSRYHAVLQYRAVPDGDLDKGFYLYDLESTHGTFLNKARLKPKVYARIKVGHMIKFGCSTRFFILQGPDYDEEEESELSLTELKEKRKLELEERKRKEEEEIRLREEEEERERQLMEERGISWGLGEDANEEEDLSENPYAVVTNEELYSDDPKKALRRWFEREGEELQFLTEQAEKGLIACKIVLPLDDDVGKEIVVETTARSKREAQVQCALEACRTIDKLGLFRQSKQESKRRQKRDWEENDYYDSDEDSFFDRTGDLDSKRQKRMKKAGKIQETVETYESLMEKHVSVIERLADSELKLQKLLALDKVKVEKEDEEIDALDSFMNTLKADRPAKLDIKIAKDEVAKLKKEEEHLRKLINIVKPTSLPELKPFKREPLPAKEEILESDNSNPKAKVTEKLKSVEPTEHDAASEENGAKPPRVIGPTMPSKMEVNEVKKSKKKSNKQQKTEKVNSEVPTEQDDDYINLIWQPPKGQTGDGRTSLNDKLGY